MTDKKTIEAKGDLTEESLTNTFVEIQNTKSEYEESQIHISINPKYAQIMLENLLVDFINATRVKIIYDEDGGCPYREKDINPEVIAAALQELLEWRKLVETGN